jgi:16S rRNA G966 N2-methylase RsmD
LEESKIEYDAAKSSNFLVKEVFLEKSEGPFNILAKGDNLAFIKHLIENKELNGKLKLVYIDPPFF